MQKITEIKETKYRTVREKDAYGNRTTKKVAYQGYMEVKTVSGGKRFAHFFVDTIVFQVIYSLFETFINLIPLENKAPSFHLILGVFSIGFFFTFMYPIYYLFFEKIFQRTPGKFLTKCRVIDIYGNPPEFGTLILRSIIRLVPFESFSCLFADRGWHDKWSNTFVVTDEEHEKIQKLLKSTNSML